MSESTTSTRHDGVAVEDAPIERPEVSAARQALAALTADERTLLLYQFAALRCQWVLVLSDLTAPAAGLPAAAPAR